MKEGLRTLRKMKEFCGTLQLCTQSGKMKKDDIMVQKFADREGTIEVKSPPGFLEIVDGKLLILLL